MEQVENRRLPRREVDLHATPLGPQLLWINREIAHGETPLYTTTRLRPSQHRPNSREQFASAKRLPNEVVRSELQPDHNIDLLVLGREKQNRRRRILLAHAPAYLEA